MVDCVFTFCAKFPVFLIIAIGIAICDAGHYIKKDHSLIKPYAGITVWLTLIWPARP